MSVNELWFEVPEIPPSVNKLYFSRGRRRILTTEGERFKKRFVTSRGGVDPIDLLSFSADPHGEFELHMWFFLSFERLYNITFGKDRRVTSPFADLDTSNLIKVTEDAISELVGIRDRNNFTICAHKRETHTQEKIVALLRPLNLAEDPWALTND